MLHFQAAAGKLQAPDKRPGSSCRCAFGKTGGNRTGYELNEDIPDDFEGYYDIINILIAIVNGKYRSQSRITDMGCMKLLTKAPRNSKHMQIKICNKN